MTPEEILQSALIPMQAAVNNYGQGNIELQRMQALNALNQQARQTERDQEAALAMTMLQKRIAADKEQRDAYLKMTRENLTETQKWGLLETAMKSGGFKYDPDRSLDDNIKAAQTTLDTSSSSRANALFRMEKEIGDRKAQHLAGLTNLVATEAPNKFMDELPQEEREAVSKLMTKRKLSFDKALKEAKLIYPDIEQRYEAKKQALMTLYESSIPYPKDLQSMIQNYDITASKIIQNAGGEYVLAKLDELRLGGFGQPEKPPGSGKNKPGTGSQTAADTEGSGLATALAAGAGGGDTGSGGVLDSDLPAALQPEAVREALYTVNKNWAKEQLAPDALITESARKAELQRKALQDELDALNVTIGPNGQPNVPMTKSTPMVFAGPGGYSPVFINRQPLSVEQRSQALARATDLIAKRKALMDAIQVLSPTSDIMNTPPYMDSEAAASASIPGLPGDYRQYLPAMQPPYMDSEAAAGASIPGLQSGYQWYTPSTPERSALDNLINFDPVSLTRQSMDAGMTPFKMTGRAMQSTVPWIDALFSPLRNAGTRIGNWINRKPN